VLRFHSEEFPRRPTLPPFRASVSLHKIVFNLAPVAVTPDPVEKKIFRLDRTVKVRSAVRVAAELASKETFPSVVVIPCASRVTFLAASSF
jgi:hypothetical protein